MMNKTDEAVKNLTHFFTHTEDVEYMAFQLRRAAFTLLTMGAGSDLPGILKDIADISYSLHHLAEQIDPYFNLHGDGMME